ncbi:MAG: presenilin family intramembrane aspartyl protease [Candidatus Woesearchaeota archaeon]
MKHTILITTILLLVFFTSQIAGLYIVSKYVDIEKTEQVREETGELEVVVYKELPYNIERPEVEEQNSWLYITIAVIISSVIALIIIKYAKINIWKLWYFAAVVLTLTISFAAMMPQFIAFILSFLSGIFKVYKPNILVHNITEIFIYGGIAAIFVPVMNLWSAIILLLVISVYDMYAVWKSKHMVTIAKFQSKTQTFAGIFIPYKRIEPKKAVELKFAKKVELVPKNAVLGGGDIAFPLLFEGVVMKKVGFLVASLIPITTTIALGALLFLAKKDRFYPAMPFILIGCFVGHLIILAL